MAMTNFSLKDIKQKIDNKQIGDFDGTENAYGIHYRRPPDSPPQIAEEALSAKRLAMELSFTDEYLKARWQRYWLSCCLNPKCDYIFAVLKECNINRERNLLDIIEAWENNNFWKYLGSEHGKSYYIDTCIKFLLRRYNWIDALKLWWKYNKRSFSGINLLLPRLIGAIILGFIPLVMADEIWQFPSKMYAESVTDYWLLSILLPGVSWIYLLIECRNTVGKVKFFRPSLVFIGGVIISLFLSFFIVVPLLSSYISTSDVSCKQTKLLFASLALFIGIFIQVFWEEKTITEPL